MIKVNSNQKIKINRDIFNLNFFMLIMGILEFVVLILVDNTTHKVIIGMGLVICILIANSTIIIIKSIVKQKGDE